MYEIASIASMARLDSPSAVMQEQFNVQGGGRIDFASLISDKVSDVNQKIEHAEKSMIDYIRGDNVAVHDVMIALGKANSEIRLAAEIRNNIISAYKTVTAMQI